jgi:hypothetical protein
MTLGAGDDRSDLRYFGRGHTKGEAWVLFPALRTGHSAVMTPEDLRESAESTRTCGRRCREGKKVKRGVAEIVKSWSIPERYKGYAPPDATVLQSNIENIYKELP